ncbi:Protein kinase domain protein [Clavibacter michiganensis subsp. michiganensis]|uniref:Protein kinase domain protein n=1 Tax=Clavibacter michiganensis subsp. michiganensis TaxID=33013 RepID=A0A251XER8_CLAMM|nr:Protein kinase domain protein [Clavibacter michiganensis subsp. michiganensis]OUE00757.1 Protein kinase domain protein [Clavibacter michiganensis subsp. michiganensis]
MPDGSAQPHVGPLRGRGRGEGPRRETIDGGSGASTALIPRRTRSRAADTATAGSTVAGYRLVRLIGKGMRCEVHLARPCRAADASAGVTDNVAVKIVPRTERSRGEAEILALQAVTSDHVVELRDVATLSDGSLCIVQSLGTRGTAAALLGRRGSLTPGETVTLVASVLRGLGDLHDVGIAHGAVDLTHVVIDATAVRCWAGWGPPASSRERRAKRASGASTPSIRTWGGSRASCRRYATRGTRTDEHRTTGGRHGWRSSTERSTASPISAPTTSLTDCSTSRMRHRWPMPAQPATRRTRIAPCRTERSPSMPVPTPSAAALGMPRDPVARRGPSRAHVGALIAGIGRRALRGRTTSMLGSPR